MSLPLASTMTRTCMNNSVSIDIGICTKIRYLYKNQVFVQKPGICTKTSICIEIMYLYKIHVFVQKSGICIVEIPWRYSNKVSVSINLNSLMVNITLSQTVGCVLLGVFHMSIFNFWPEIP